MFDIRWLGAVNGFFLLLGIGLWLYALSRCWRVYLGLLLVVIWTDVAYVQYLNSFYMDTAAMIFLVLCVAACLHVIENRNSRLFAALMVTAAVLFATSKFQHSVPAFAFIPFFTALVFWTSDRVVRVLFAAAPILILVGGLLLMGRIDEQVRSVPVFNIVFMRIAPQSADPLHTLEELGLGNSELPFLNTHAYFPNSPVGDAGWAHRFHQHCNYATLLNYYLRHPSVPARFLYGGLSGSASRISGVRMNLSTYDGFRPGARARRFGIWTRFRSFLFRRAPWHVNVLTFVSLAGALYLFCSPLDRPFAALVLTIQSVGALEYGIAVLADAAETKRHLFLFHVATEISILLLPCLLHKVYLLHQRRTRPGQSFTFPKLTHWGGRRGPGVVAQNITGDGSP
ncbi:MAG TPA: hypothetical protein VFU27_08440 [Terriglobales bacterium]|nr:hypothetical protein [Terriglobales bacterium]